MRLLAAFLLAAACGSAVAGSFSSGAFSPTAFSPSAFLFDDAEAPPDIEVPSCAGLSGAACESAVEGEGLTASLVETCSSTVSDGDVIATIPPAGTQVELGSVVRIVVSNGETCASAGGGSNRIRLGIGIGL